MTVAILLLGYFPAHILRFFYDGESNRFTGARLQHRQRHQHGHGPAVGRPEGVRSRTLRPARTPRLPVAAAMLGS